MYVEVVRQSDKLHQEVWRFVLIREIELVLIRYRRCDRKTPRHGWNTQKCYDAYARQGSVERDSSWVPFPRNITDEALRKLVEQIHVKKEF